jgi:hypothetical protein
MDAAPGTAHFEVGIFRTFDYRPAGHGRASWVYSLLNLILDDGDLFVVESHRAGSGWHRDAIQFQFGGRTWVVRDRLRTLSQKERRELEDGPHAIRSGILWTDCLPEDKEEVVDRLASEICDILSFATGKCVRWHQRRLLNDRGVRQRWMNHYPWCAPMSDGAKSSPIDTDSTGVLKAFIESASPRIQEDSDWWTHTLGLHLQAVLSPIIDVHLRHSSRR